jgi:hypothetical protein
MGIIPGEEAKRESVGAMMAGLRPPPSFPPKPALSLALSVVEGEVEGLGGMRGGQRHEDR